MLNKKIIIIPIVAIIAIFLVNFLPDGSTEKKMPVFHATLADPLLYVDGVYTDTFTMEGGEYVFRFVPNGSSPKVLSIILSGDTFNFSESYTLVGTLQQTGISEYYTWDYDGQKDIAISEMQEITITINPNGETQSSVSVDILEN